MVEAAQEEVLLGGDLVKARLLELAIAAHDDDVVDRPEAPLEASFSLRLVTEVSLVLTRDEFATERSPAPAAPAPADVSTFYEISPVSFDVGIGAAHVF